MKREIKPIACQKQPLDTTDFAADPSGWFQKHSDVGDEAWFLAHADDGVIWGQIRNRQLVTSDSVFPQVSPPFRPVTLQQARLFGESAEVRVWREGNEFKAWRLEDHHNEEAEAFDEAHVLWGTRAEARKGGFTLVVDGRQGLRHVMPLEATDTALGAGGRRHPLRLCVRHYLDYDKDGQARIALSRLVALRQLPGGGQDEPQA
jgi:CRISPR-associated protein (TIGR03984 family)